ncbi:tRNA (adenosine(37)-N6)-dimethylallyltransferase MiaA [uncultured Bifidobacterium sp.]|uniref:tRNA (adenosine(37)-N6)-dimethylallyltransferase MiaA n=1 Tax=uncultured Bifidobacterium sp. TaxID=165187 RepID=UPI0028DD21BC|nr:tRNA (adenosine(37)-N6)-dimethylallyltransferase MiaA [uncultured Bifidobacterium sp.]
MTYDADADEADDGWNDPLDGTSTVPGGPSGRAPERTDHADPQPMDAPQDGSGSRDAAGSAAAAGHQDSRRVVSIVGPTASGKTRLAIAVARSLTAQGDRTQIVNADAYQMYRGMSIGTAKPTAEERAAVPHHLLDVIDPDENMTVARFQGMVRDCIAELKSRGVRPLLVGGSGLYARAALDEMSFPGTDRAVRAGLERRLDEEGAGALFEELRRRDPEAAARMDPRNPRRTIRALEVIELTGRPYSASLPRYRYAIPAVQIGLDMPREDIDHRIEVRTVRMREAGFVDEVRWIRQRLGPTAARALGYQQVADYLDGLWSEDEAFADIARRTRRLARKQMGWFGRDPRIHWLDAGGPRLLRNALAVIRHADAGYYDETDSHADDVVRRHLGAFDGTGVVEGAA